MDFSEALFENFEVLMLIFARICGLFSFNPILSRSNVPARVKVGTSLAISYVLWLAVDVGEIDTGTAMGEFVMCIVRELFIGFVLGFICTMFMYSIYFAGDIMDSQAGLGMAKVMDPGSHIQMSVFGSFAGYFMYIYFFISNSHLMLIRIFADSFDIIPLCSGYPDSQIGWGIIEMFTHLMSMLLQLAMPVIAAEFIMEACMGLLMKTVPQIRAMVINIQLKVVMGSVILLAITPSIAEFIEDYMDNMLNTCSEVLPYIFK